MVYDGKIVKVYRDNVELVDGHKSFREVVRHSGGVVIVAFRDENTILLVKQYRYPIAKTVLELPAGKLEKGEDPFEAAKRELEEETGYCANKWTDLGYINTSPGFSDETLHIYLATGLAQQETERDEDEFIELFTLPLEEAYQQAMRGALPDAKTIAGLAMAHARWTAEHTKGE